MKETLKSVKNFSAIMGILFIMLGACLADSKSLIPTLVFVIIGAVFTYICIQMGIWEREED